MHTLFDFETVFKFLSRLIGMLLVIPVHEAAHAVTAKWFGDDTAERAGRISISPFAHIDPIGSLLMLFTGFGWAKPVPINPLRMKKQRLGVALTALAGPLSNILFAILTSLAYNLILCTESGLLAYASSQFTPMSAVLLLLQLVFQINIGLAVFNLIPIPPLDGYNIVSYFTSAKFDRWVYQHMREISIAFIALLIIFSMPNVPSPLGMIANAVGNAVWHITSWIPVVRWNG